MGRILLVRHGQANSAATNDTDYDRLSDLGHLQAEWLGAWLRDHGREFDHVICGSLRRHRETTAGMGYSPDIDPRLNEIDYYKLTDDLSARHGVPAPGPEEFEDHMPRVLAAWQKAEIDGTETFETFHTRAAEMLAEASIPGRRLLCVTSGGVIGMMLSQILGLDLRRMAQVMLPIFNTSVHELHVRPSGPILAGFNATPHLETPDRAYARTNY